MKFSAFEAAFGSAMLLLVSTPACQATSHHRHHHLHNKDSELHVRHVHSHPEEHSSMIKRTGSCPFPTDDPDLVAVTPDEMNAGWAMSPNQECTPNSYCPIACKPGMVMAQWDQAATSYSYPMSMNGGLYCDSNGEIQKPFPDKPNCVPGTGTVSAVNSCGEPMSWCQTVLPGNEAMLVPTLVESETMIAVPGPSYWCETAAHYYVNPPGTGVEGCVWGTATSPWGNWSPYVAGANTDSTGNTYVKIGLNPIFMSSGLVSSTPTYGLKIECPGGGCNGLPCSIDPRNGLSVSSPDAAVGAGDAAFCVVTVPSGGSAQIIAFSADGESSSSSSSSSLSSEPESEGSSSEPSSTQESTTEAPTSTSTSTTPTPTPTSTSTTSTTSSSTSTSSTSSTTTSSSTTSTSTSKTSSTYASTTSSSMNKHQHNHNYFPGIFHENDTSVSTESSKASTATLTSTSTSTQSSVAPTTDKKGEAVRKQGSAALGGLVVAFIATACLF